MRNTLEFLDRAELAWFNRRNSDVLSNGRLATVRSSGQLWLARVAPGMTEDQAFEHNLDLVLGILARAGISYFAIPDEDLRRVRIAVEEDSWQAFVDHVSVQQRNDPHYIGVEACGVASRRVRWSASPSDPVARSAARRQSVVEVFKIFAEDVDVRILGRSYGCRVEKWSRSDSGALLAPVRNTRTTAVGKRHQVEVSFEFRGKSLRTYEPLIRRNVFEVSDPVDLVYMWVDGSDEAWQARKNQLLSAKTGVSASGTDSSRFRDNGELRFSLRSVHQFAPWARRILLVTDQQVPSWLDTAHPHIRIVDHRELFGDAGALPTFNSHAIGSRLHHIPGLSGNYLIFNDDVFLGRSVPQGLFFRSNGVAKFFLSRSTLPYEGGEEELPHEGARRNVVSLIEETYGVTAARTFYHTPIPQRKRILFELERAYPDVFLHNWTSQFRSNRDFEVNGWMHHYFGYLKGLAEPGAVRYDYFDLADPAVPQRMDRLFSRRDVDCFCINDNRDALDANHEYIQKWLPKYYSVAAPWEL